MSQKMTTEELIERYQLLAKQRADIDAEMEAIKDTVRADYKIGKYETPAGAITVSDNRRFDEATALTVLTPAERKACTAPSLQSSLVKKLISPLRYEQCMKSVGDPKVQIS